MYPRLTALVILLLVLLSFVIGAVYYPRLPDPMATHWDGNDRIDGYMGRFWGAFFVPAMLLVLWLVSLVGVGMGLTASALPAIRASNVQPVEALRSE